jgi:hypothetical protein
VATAIGRERNIMRRKWMSRALSGTPPEQASNLDGVKGEQMIREQAYELWDNAGRPGGRSDEFWFAARSEFERGEETKLSAHVPPHVGPSRHEQ